jgi:N-acylneuraminate cytidylyltransferase
VTGGAIAVIPARGGSKRIPRKNIREFAGKPIIAHSIECALRSGLFERVIVSTDDAEISEVARQFGAEVPFTRPLELSGDHTGTAEVITHAVRFVLNEGTQVSAVCCIYPTAPFLRSEDLARGLQVLESGELQFVFAATTFAYPIFRSFRRESNGGLSMLFPEHLNTRSQDLPEVLHDAGQFYWGKKDAWLHYTNIFGEFSSVVSIPRWRVQDIDTEEDWTRAEAMASSIDAHTTTNASESPITGRRR